MKKLFTVILALSVAVGLIACSSSPGNESNGNGIPSDETVETDALETEFDIEAYEELVNDFREEVGSSIKSLRVMYSYQSSYWEAYQRPRGDVPDLNELVKKGYDNLEDIDGVTKESLEELNNEIRGDYKELILTEIDGREAEELDGAVRDMYEAYTNMYDNVTHIPGDLDTFQSVATESLDTFSESEDTIKLLLDIED